MTKKISKLLSDRYFWAVAGLLCIAAIFTYSFHGRFPNMFSPETKNDMELLFTAVQTGLLLLAVVIAAWQYKFRGGLTTAFAIGIMLFPNLLVDIVANGIRPGHLSLYPIGMVTGIGLSWFISHRRSMQEELIKTEERIKQANQNLSISTRKLEEINNQHKMLSEMSEMLHSCAKIDEIGPIVFSYATKILPGTNGALFMMNDSRSILQSIVSWGDFPVDADSNIFAPEACWGMRRGRTYTVENVKTTPVCQHIKQPATPYICLPLVGKGEILGLLYLTVQFLKQDDAGQTNITELHEIVTKFADYLSLSVANIKLWEKVSNQSLRDPLTGLFNRYYLTETLQREILRAAREETKVGVVMADIDHFKNINDTYGHEAGDEVLIRLAEYFKAKTRGSDVVCRFGGEEFIIVLPKSSLDDTYKKADSLREGFENLKIMFRGQLLPPITLSAGTSMYPDHGQDMNELLRVADTALYKAKSEGRNRVISG